MYFLDEANNMIYSNTTSKMIEMLVVMFEGVYLGYLKSQPVHKLRNAHALNVSISISLM